MGRRTFFLEQEFSSFIRTAEGPGTPRKLEMTALVPPAFSSGPGSYLCHGSFRLALEAWSLNPESPLTGRVITFPVLPTSHSNRGKRVRK